jgi:Arf-GAP/coiled-coil/ANK repeat/PH domain-containing protein
MKPIIDISQAGLDTPDYRVQISRTEQSIWNLESSVKSLLKSTKNGVEAATEYSAKNSLFATELNGLAAEEADELVVQATLSKFAGCIQEIERSRQIMLSQLRDVFIEPLDNFVKKDVAGVKVSATGLSSATLICTNTLS